MATTKAKKAYSEVEFGPDDYIMFGKESAGIPEEILVDYEDTCVRIPMLDEIRSLNLSNSVSIILYEALRQNNFAQMKMEGELHHLQWKNNEEAKKEKRENRKRRIKKAGLISLIISTILMFANFLLGKLVGNILGIILWGGEMSDTIGFGIRLFKTYPMSSIDEPVVSSSSLYFEPISFIITVLLVMLIVYPICCSREKRKKK